MKRADAPAVLDGLRTLFAVGGLGGMTDGQLLAWFGSGAAEAAEPAFVALVERHGPMVLGVCRRLLRDDHLAEDAFQATFLVLARRGATIRDGATLGGWLHRVARRVALRARASLDHQRRFERTEVGESVVPAVDLAERREVRAVIDAELDRLAAAHRLPIVLCDLEGLTHEEAARQLRWPVGTVKSRLARGRSRLRDRLRRSGIAPAVPLGLVAEGAAALVPPPLVTLTARQAVGFAAGRSVAAVAASAVASLARKEWLAMSFARWTVPGVVASLGALVASGSVWLGKPPAPSEPIATPVLLAVAPVQEPASTPPALTLEATGRVVAAAGRPVAGATVLIREWSTWRTIGWRPEQYARLNQGETIPDILARTRTDADGRFRFAGVAAPPFPEERGAEIGKTEFPYDVVVLADGHGVIHEHLTAVNQKRPLTLVLPAEQLVRGRIIEPGGRPIAGARVSVAGVGRIGEDDQHTQKTVGMLNLGWSSVPLAAVTDADGRFTLRNLPAERQMSLIFRADGHARDYLTYATTAKPPADLTDVSIRSGQRSETSIPIRTGDLTVELKPADHRLVGRVVFEDGGKPVGGVKVFRGQRSVGDTDAEGRFTIDDLTTGPFELQVSGWPTDAAPLSTRVEIPAEPKVVERTFLLPRGATLTGQVTDEATGQGVEGVELRYDARIEPGSVWSFFGFGGKTDSAGRYRFVASAGRGKLELVGVPPSHPPLPMRGVGEPARTRFSRDVEGAKGATITADFTIPHGQGVTLRALGADGRPVEGAEVRRMSLFQNDKVVGRTDAAGQVVLVGLDPSKRHTADLLHPTRRLGARVIVPTHPAGAIEVPLTPLGSVASRVLDAAGQPLEGALVRLYNTVEFPEGYGMPVGTILADQTGNFRFDRLIAGVEYYFEIRADGRANATSERFQVTPGAELVVAESRLRDTTQTLDGFVVDPRGNRLAQVSVGVQTDPLTRYTPSGRFFGDTDGRGEFHLDGLPEGELTVMVYRHPEGGDRTIKHSIRVKVQAGSKDVRIVLPDPNARLQGIED